ncbi:hypothetical protein F638_1460 [Pseudomonas sp. LAIL14HWK12:I2]|jgi:hypothetical protein|uniref:hypothetical protein n=1 Tax=Pseudomonas sp. LAIL14HWK12:I2 TaxID=1265482 RepID=UPI00106771D8|nr:hypothetical protein [Pseudomonas sp. LAIL14HWK12:I2]TFA85209.1 hypothetical protein F638_1460 [Pseudomonas sp. LAIL14HWK12:I2]
MQVCQVYEGVVEVADRLGQLRMPAKAIAEAVYQGHLHRVRLTPNHPGIFPGMEMWGWIVSSLRDQLRPFGWMAHENANYPLTVHPDLLLALTVASADAGVGNSSCTPTNRSKKGKSTVDAVQQNRQLDMFAELLPQLSSTHGTDGHETWILLHHTDTVTNEIRLELSRPASIGRGGKITAWFERILLSPIDLNDDFIALSTPSGADIEIDIRRKNA